MKTPDASNVPLPDLVAEPGRMLLQRYRVEKLLGYGGMGEVLLAHDTLLDRPVALKRLRAGTEEAAKRRNAILKEARRASQIIDHRIAAIYDVLDLGQDVLIVMEYVDGSSLRMRMTEPLPIETFWHLSIQCVEAVAAAHAHGLVHRDIKPENFMVTRDGQIKILDFGIAKRVKPPEGEASRIATTTVDAGPGIIIGTPEYMAPETLYGGEIDPRTDLFSLGTTFYELLAGRHPFAAATYEGVVAGIMNTTPPAVSDLNPGVGRRLSDVITKMLAKDPGQRYASCAELMQHLIQVRDAGEEIPDSEHPTAQQAAHLTPSRFGWMSTRWAAVVFPTIGVASTVVVWSLWGNGFAPVLPKDRNVAVLAPLSPGATDDFTSFALGSVQLLHHRLQKRQDLPGFQVASFQEGLDEKVQTAEDARKILGSNLAVLPTFEQRTGSFRARVDLWDTARGRLLASRKIETPVSQPFAFLEAVSRDVERMLQLGESDDHASTYGVRGAGTLRFLLQGIGRLGSSSTEAQVARAVEDLELACRTEPEAGMARAWLSAAQHKRYTLGNELGWLERAEESGREAIRLDSTRAEAHRILAAVFYAQKNSAASLDELEKARALNPMDDDVSLRLGRLHARLGQPEKERQVYQAAIASRPHCWQPHWWLATWHFRQGHVEEAIRAYEEMVRRAPDLYKGYTSLGGLLVLHGDYEPAIAALRKSIALRPSKTAFDNLGTAYFNSDSLQEAIACYNQSFQFGFADYGSWLNLGDAYYWLRNRRDQAIEAYRQAVRLGREESLARARKGNTFDLMIPANLATVYPKLGQPDSARVCLGQALATDSTNSMVQYCAALTCWQLGQKARALDWLERAVHAGYPVAWIRDSPIFREWQPEARFLALIAGDERSRGAVVRSEGGGR